MVNRIKQLKEDMNAAGRKYKLALVSLLVIFSSFVLSGLVPGFVSIFEELIGGVVAILVVYCGGNITNKWVQKPKKDTKKEKTKTEE